MRVTFIGAGPSCLLSAILLKTRRSDLDVVIIEKEKIVGRKIKATGNGKCNIAPISDDVNRYNNPAFVKDLFDRVSFDEYLETFFNIGIPLKSIENFGYYPVSESAPNVASTLSGRALYLGIKILTEIKLLDYLKFNNGYLLKTNTKDFYTDVLVFGSGGKSTPNLGSDGSLFEVFENHGYRINDLKPILCPLTVVDNVKDLFGVRLFANVRLTENGKDVFQEEGEVNFKKDALSGIVIFNASSKIENGKYKISLNLLQTSKYSIDKDDFIRAYSINKNLDGFFPRQVQIYINKKYPNLDASQLYDVLCNLEFAVKDKYGFEDAHVTRGGVDLNFINDFESKHEPNVYFIGEVLDIDGMCGGYNLRYCFSAGIYLADKFSKKL